MGDDHEDNTLANLTNHPHIPSDVNHEGQSKGSCLKNAMRWLKHDNESKWLEDMRGMLSLVATMIATMTFQVAMNPPGGVLKEEEEHDERNYRNQNYYRQFQIYNTISFVASLSVTLVLVSGIPLNHKFPIWMLSIGMIITLSFLALTYLFGLLLVTPKNESSWAYWGTYRCAIGAWILLIGTVALFLTIRFLAWFISRCIKPNDTQSKDVATQAPKDVL